MPETELINNWVFASFSDSDQAALRPFLQRVFVSQDDRLNLTGETVEHVYFPVTSAMANVVRSPEGSEASAATVGRDGMTGLAAFLADEILGWDVQAYVGGYAWRLDAEALRSQVKTNPDLALTLTRAAHREQTETARTALCASNHRTTNRLATWLLATQDKTALQELPITQGHLSMLLSVQRTTVVQSFSSLKENGSIRSSRGNIRIVDRALLKTQACSCYAGRS